MKLPSISKQVLIITSVGLGLDIIEAVWHYNKGKSQDGEFHFRFPPLKEFGGTLGVVLLTNLLAAGIGSVIVNAIPDKPTLITATN